MLISPFTPLFFIDPKVDGIDSPYIQTFANTDRIIIQLISCDEDYEWQGHLIDMASGKELAITFTRWYLNNTDFVDFLILQGLSDGLYSFRLSHADCELVSAPFLVTSDQNILQDTTLLQYSMRDNRQRTDAAFFIDGMQYFFEFRVPGGFQDAGWTFGVNEEQFATDNADPIQLYGRESTMRKLTIGTSEGCPIWFGEMVNRLLCCHYVYVDGVRYSRVEGSVPEVANTLEGVNSFVISQNLQQVIDDDLMSRYGITAPLQGGIYNPDLGRRFNDRNIAILRRVNGSNFRKAEGKDKEYLINL